MKLSQLYPYWEDAHTLWLDRVATLTEADLDAWAAPRSRTVRRVLLDFLRRERLLVAHLVAGWDVDALSPGGTRTGREMADALSAARETTRLALAPLETENMRQVRVVPEGVFGNEPAGNVAVAFLVWSLLEAELGAQAVMQLKLSEGRG